MAVTIDLSAAHMAVDEIVGIRVNGLEPNQAVTVRASLALADRWFSSHASFVAPLDGTVDLGVLAPVGGTYAGADAMGMYWRPDRPPRPAVMVLGGSEGGLAWSQFIAAGLASNGYSALALAYFGCDKLPPHLSLIPLEYFERALEWMARHPGVDGDRLAVLGASRGGELALLLGATFPTVRAVVAYSPAPRGVVRDSFRFPEAPVGVVARGK